MSKEVNKDIEEVVEETVVEEAVETDNEDVVEQTQEENVVEETEESEDEQSDDKKSKKKLFGNKKDKKDEIIEDLTDRNTRLMAEFQNFRNRSEKEKSSMFELGAKSIIEKILPLVDNFERGLATLSEDDLASPVGQGMSMIYKQFTTTLTEMGVEVIEAEGCEFNPELHNAVMHEDNDEVGENIIVQEFQKGYKYKDTVLRYSMVKVAN